MVKKGISTDKGSGRKRGQLATEEENFILANKDKMSIDEMAEALNRTPDPIKRYLGEKMVPHSDMDVSESAALSLRAKLHSRPYWKEICKQFEGEELKYFENIWIEFVAQFKEDIVATEEMEINQWITLTILMNRSMKDRKLHIEMMDRLQIKVNEEMQKPLIERDAALLMSLEEQLSFARNSVGSYTREHATLQGQVKDIRRDLKAIRSDRISKIEDRKTSFVGLLRQLEEGDIREKEGLEAEIIARAAVKAKNDFGQLHTFDDNRLDRPILNADTVELGEEEDGETSEEA